MKFKQTKAPSLMGGNEHRFTEDSTSENAFTVVADSIGIKFKGNSDYLYDTADLEDLAKTISAAWTAHRQLKPKLTTTPSGH